MKDPLDVEVALVVNSMVHGFLVERIDPPLRKSPKQGEEIKAQYAFSNALVRKVLNCRLVIISRAGSKGGEMRKVMCRVGGGESCKVVLFVVTYPPFTSQDGKICPCIC
jgi:hypothetical protein